MELFAYYLELALRSLKRSQGLTALMVLAIGQVTVFVPARRASRVPQVVAMRAT